MLFLVVIICLVSRVSYEVNARLLEKTKRKRLLFRHKDCRGLQISTNGEKKIFLFSWHWTWEKNIISQGSCNHCQPIDRKFIYLLQKFLCTFSKSFSWGYFIPDSWDRKKVCNMGILSIWSMFSFRLEKKKNIQFIWQPLWRKRTQVSHVSVLEN